jgi:hypothetical protein
MALGSTQPLVKMSTRNIPGGKGGRCVRLTTSLPSSIECHEIWEPKLRGTLWATPGLLRESFTFSTTFSTRSDPSTGSHCTWDQTLAFTEVKTPNNESSFFSLFSVCNDTLHYKCDISKTDFGRGYSECHPNPQPGSDVTNLQPALYQL